MAYLTIVVDNHCDRSGLLAEWGYCAHLETEHGTLLLDTGGLGHIALANAQTLGIRLSQIGHIVLSHGHYDHVSGLVDFCGVNSQVKLWGAASIGRTRFGGSNAERVNGGSSLFDMSKLTKIEESARILPGVTAFVVPKEERDPRYIVTRNLWEQDSEGRAVPDSFADDLSLLIETEQGYSVLLGCAHSGTVNILRYAQKRFGVDKFSFVVGGTHFSAFSPEELSQTFDALQKIEIAHWRPNHCTGFVAASELKRRGADVLWAGAGTKILL